MKIKLAMLSAACAFLCSGAVFAAEQGQVVSTPQGGASIKTTQGQGAAVATVAAPQNGGAAGIGSGGINGSMGSPVGNSGGGSQTFGGGLTGTGPLSTPPAAAAGGAAGGPL